MNNLIPVNEIQTMAMAVAKSGLFGMKTPEQALALMLVAQSEGLHPARAAMEYHVIQGRPALKADAMLARFQSNGGKVEWHDYTDEIVSGTFSHPSGGSVRIDWTIDRARQAGVYGKNPTWKSYPRAMLRSRCISEGIRTVFPGVSVGVYTVEEVQDFQPEEKDITSHTTEQKIANVAKAKAALKPPVATISGDASEGDLSEVAPLKPNQADIDKMLAAFAKIGMDAATVEREYNKPLAEWMVEDLAEAREVYKECKADYDLQQAAEGKTQQEI